jgi:hypothetical protein
MAKVDSWTCLRLILRGTGLRQALVRIKEFVMVVGLMMGVMVKIVEVSRKGNIEAMMVM